MEAKYLQVHVHQKPRCVVVDSLLSVFLTLQAESESSMCEQFDSCPPMLYRPEHVELRPKLRV